MYVTTKNFRYYIKELPTILFEIEIQQYHCMILNKFIADKKVVIHYLWFRVNYFNLYQNVLLPKIKHLKYRYVKRSRQYLKLYCSYLEDVRQ